MTRIPSLLVFIFIFFNHSETMQLALTLYFFLLDLPARRSNRPCWSQKGIPKTYTTFGSFSNGLFYLASIFSFLLLSTSSMYQAVLLMFLRKQYRSCSLSFKHGHQKGWMKKLATTSFWFWTCGQSVLRCLTPWGL